MGRLLLAGDVGQRLPLASRTMKDRRSSLESASSTDQGGGKRRDISARPPNQHAAGHATSYRPKQQLEGHIDAVEWAPSTASFSTEDADLCRAVHFRSAPKADVKSL